MKTQPVKIRLPVTWLEAIRTKGEEEGIPQPERGKTGGPAEWIRRLIARELGEEMFDPHLLQKGKKNFAHSHNLRVWLVDKNLHPKLNPMGLGLVVTSTDFLGRLGVQVHDLQFVCTLKETPTKALKTKEVNPWDPAEYIIIELHGRNNLGLQPGFYHIPSRRAEDAIRAYGLSAFTAFDEERFKLSDDYTQIVLDEIAQEDEDGVFG